jgi:methionyl-tRNA formyltransferase
MRVVFMGYQSWGNVTLRAVLAAGHEVPLVVTHPSSDDPYESIWPNEVAEIAAERGIPCIERVYADDKGVADAIAAARPEVIVASNWRTWLAASVYELAKHGALNIHDALLPRYAGLSVLNWAVANGETETGVTVHFMAEDIDLGDIAVQERVPIRPGDTATDLLHRTLPLFSELAVRALADLDAGALERRPQDRREATFFHKRTELDGLIDWNAPPELVHNLVRAQSDPYPNAYTFHAGRRLRVKRTSMPARTYCGTPGRVVCRQGDGVVVVCGGNARPNQAVVLEVVETDDGPPIAAAVHFERMGEQLGVEMPAARPTLEAP